MCFVPRLRCGRKAIMVVIAAFKSAVKTSVAEKGPFPRKIALVITNRFPFRSMGEERWIGKLVVVNQVTSIRRPRVTTLTVTRNGRLEAVLSGFVLSDLKVLLAVFHGVVGVVTEVILEVVLLPSVARWRRQSKEGLEALDL